MSMSKAAQRLTEVVRAVVPPVDAGRRFMGEWAGKARGARLEDIPNAAHRRFVWAVESFSERPSEMSRRRRGVLRLDRRVELKQLPGSAEGALFAIESVNDALISAIVRPENWQTATSTIIALQYERAEASAVGDADKALIVSLYFTLLHQEC